MSDMTTASDVPRIAESAVEVRQFKGNAENKRSNFEKSVQSACLTNSISESDALVLLLMYPK